MIETTLSIAEWADQTFGPAPSLARVAVRANEEMSELVTEVLTGGKGFHARFVEAADVTIVLCRLAARYNIDLFVTVADTCINEHTDPMVMLAAANKCMAATLRAKTAEMPDNIIIQSIRDTVEYLTAFCRVYGVDLWAEVEIKMAINRARTWKIDGTGHGYHVRAAEGGAA